MSLLFIESELMESIDSIQCHWLLFDIEIMEICIKLNIYKVYQIKGSTLL